MRKDRKASVATPKLVRQKDKRGCAIACLSMITGIDYDQIGQELAEYHWKADGLTSRAADQYLADHGYAVQRRYPVHANGKPRPEWPTLFTDVHIAKVSKPQSHHVIVLRDGTVLDPEHAETKRLGDYQGVHSIAGVYKCG